MKIHVSHTFDCSAERFWEVFWDEGFDAAMLKASGLAREILSDEDDGVVRRWRVRLTPDRELPKAAAAFLGSKKLIYEQENAWNRETGVLDWTVIPMVLTDKVNAQGTVIVRGLGETCVREVDGLVEVNVFLGKRVEKAIIADAEKSYARAAEAMREWLAKD